MGAERRSAPELGGTLLAQRYRVVRTIERGGMGAVYEARDEMLGRHVAVKVLLPQLSHEQHHIERFRREAVATAGLAHANVVQVSDFHCVPGEPAFLVMELLRGHTVAKTVMDGGRMTTDRVVAIGLQICAALSAAHDAGLVHRDLKPGNVFLVPLGDRRELVKVLDFGIAQMKRSEAYARLTATGAILGTPAYMPPEQARGEELDGRADVYAAGAILYTCLTARKPFSGSDPAQLIRQILSERPIPLAQLCPQVGPRLATAIETAMEKDRAHRFGSARAFADALAEAQARDLQPSASRPPSHRPPPMDSRPPSHEARLPVPTPLPAPSMRPPPPLASQPPLPPTGSARVPTPMGLPPTGSARVPTPMSLPPTAPSRSHLPGLLILGGAAVLLLLLLTAGVGGLWVTHAEWPARLAAETHVGDSPQPGQFVVTVVSAPGRDAATVDLQVAQRAALLAQCLANAQLPRGTELRYELWNWGPTEGGLGRFGTVSRIVSTPELPGPYDECGTRVLADGWPPSENVMQPVILATVFR